MDATTPIEDRSRQVLAPAARGTSQAAAPAFNSDFETFLKMLTTQMRNQDPLNPVESSDFAVQLATFSTVEQQVLTNDLLTDLGARIGGLGLRQAADWIGLEVDAASPVDFDGTSVALDATVEVGADGAEIIATDQRGIVVNRQPIAPTSGPAVWQGLDSFGRALPGGVYKLEVASLVGEQVVSTSEARLRARISAVRFESGSTRLVLDNGQEVDATEISALRQ